MLYLLKIHYTLCKKKTTVVYRCSKVINRLRKKQIRVTNLNRGKHINCKGKQRNNRNTEVQQKTKNNNAENVDI